MELPSTRRVAPRPALSFFTPRVPIPSTPPPASELATNSKPKIKPRVHEDAATNLSSSEDEVPVPKKKKKKQPPKQPASPRKKKKQVFRSPKAQKVQAPPQIVNNDLDDNEIALQEVDNGQDSTHKDVQGTDEETVTEVCLISLTYFS